MDSSLATTLITNAGVAGLGIVLIIFKVLVPGWYAKKLEQQNEILSTTAERAVNELALANQMIGELRALAYQRNALAATGHPGQGGAAGDAPVAQET